MYVQPVGQLFTANPRQLSSANDAPAHALAGGGQGGRSFLPKAASLNAGIEAEYFSSEKISMEFTSKDGDTVTLSMESVRYQRATLAVDAEGSPHDMKKILDYIKKEYASLRHDVLKDFMKTFDGGIEDTEKTPDAGTVEALNIPEYWNAENTSRRIVDFALTFFDGFKGAGEDFVKMIKDAVEKGFRKANDVLGELPEPVAKLVEDTYNLVMQKIDTWAAGKGISGSEAEEGEILSLKAAA